jgi:WD40 repeat protein
MAGDQRLITCDPRGFCKLWDLEHGREIKSWAVSSNFYSIAASPDGKLVVTGLRDGSLTFCETITGSVLESISAHLQAVNGVAFSPDGRLMLTGSAHGDAKLWNVASRKSIATLQGHLRAVDAAAFSRDGHRLVTSSGRSEAIKLWDLSTEQEVATLEANGEHFANIRFSPDGSALIAVSQAGTLHYWRAPSLNEIDAAQKRAIR